MEPASVRKPEEGVVLARWLQSLREASSRARQRILALETLARQTTEMAEMDFSLVFNPARELFSIGFNVAENRCDASFYDLLASEARLCSYVASLRGRFHRTTGSHWDVCSSLYGVIPYWLRGVDRCSNT